MKNELDELIEASKDAPEGQLASDTLESLIPEDGDGSPVVEPTDDTLTAPPAIDKAAIYEAQESNLGVADEESAAPKKGRKGKRAAKVQPETSDKDTKDEATAAPKTPASCRSEAFERKASREDLKKLGYDDEQVQGMLASMDGAPKKVSEKAYNLLRYGVGRDHLSNYTRFTLEQLSAGPMNVPELVAKMRERWGEGTSRSQSQQMSRLFIMFGLADKTTDGKLKLNKKAPLVKVALKRLSKVTDDQGDGPEA